MNSRLHLPSFWRDRREGNWKTLKRIQQDRVSYLGCLVKAWRVSSDPTSSDLFRSRSGNIQEQPFRKPGNHWGSFLRRSLPRSEILFSSFWSIKQPRGRRLSSHFLHNSLKKWLNNSSYKAASISWNGCCGKIMLESVHDSVYSVHSSSI